MAIPQRSLGAGQAARLGRAMATAGASELGAPIARAEPPGRRGHHRATAARDAAEMYLKRAWFRPHFFFSPPCFFTTGSSRLNGMNFLPSMYGCSTCASAQVTVPALH